MADRVTPAAIDPELVGELVRRALGDGPPSAVRMTQRERLVRHASASPRAAWRWPAFVGVLAAAALVLGIVQAWPAAQIEPAIADTTAAQSEWFAAPSGGVLAVDVGDGTRMELVDGARGRMTTDDAIVVLETGRLQAEVEPAANRRWTIEAGPYRVRVVGTIFSVDWDPTSGRLEVEVQRGKVEVVGPDGGSPIPVDAGHRLRASLPDATAVLGAIPTAPAEIEPPLVEDPIALEPDDADTDGSAPRKRKAIDPPPPRQRSWQDAAREGKYTEAFALADAEGFAALVRRSDAAALELLAATARYAKQFSDAKTAYAAVRERFAGTPVAARAAFELGRMAGKPDAAVQWFRTSLAEGPKGSLAPEARGRLVQALLAAGDREGARTAARDYLARHPEGPYAKLARSLLPP